MDKQDQILKILQKLEVAVTDLKLDVQDIKQDVRSLDTRVGKIEREVSAVKNHMVSKDEFMTALELLKNIHEITSHTVEHQLATQSKIKKLESGR